LKRQTGSRWLFCKFTGWYTLPCAFVYIIWRI